MTVEDEVAAMEQRDAEERRTDDLIKIMNFHNFVDAVRARIPGHPANLGISAEALQETVKLLDARLASPVAEGTMPTGSRTLLAVVVAVPPLSERAGEVSDVEVSAGGEDVRRRG